MAAIVESEKRLSPFEDVFLQHESEDRVEWDNAWASMQHRVLKTWNDAAVERIVGKDWGETAIVAITVSDNPPQFSDRIFRNSQLCPACGTSVDTDDRLPVSLYPSIQVGERTVAPTRFGGWMHSECFFGCPESDNMVPIPW